MTTTSTSTSTDSVTDLVTRLAQEHLSRWQRGYLSDDAKAVGALARLRRGAGKPAEQLPDLWDLLDTQALHDTRRDGHPLSETELARAEDALHTALTLWALHQQSRSTGMHQPHRHDRPRGLGAAVHRLMPANDIDDSLRKRLVRAGNAPDLTALAQRLRDIVTLLRREDVLLDYALLAGQLYQWQRPGGADRVRIAWGRSFHAWQDHRTPGPQQDNPAPGDLSTDLPDATDKDTP
ncbi:type I-E CRISPR-associated protein Cse2/CasB [Streptomyces sp. NPDC014773]|uniref:type I-E CRISPR-associated protein Cse2/CasB n=1 Tax=Streptomyces sp. NPDC014773 TaxID=3364908 RepID=UPI0036FEAA12